MKRCKVTSASFAAHAVQDEQLLPAVHERVGLALRLDGIVRSAAKRHADKSWMRAAAQDLGGLRPRYPFHNLDNIRLQTYGWHRAFGGQAARGQELDAGCGAGSGWVTLVSKFDQGVDAINT